ncbi:uracil-DNA glycosylase family 4 [Motilibacter rhizosphaerae]|uniref:Type-5 uracil-DNA glycosylase n=1 Tax=Motilibacter rhizosphaerae TaxID=598652 RepID=A0A4Q7NPY7_9ACTN|nr:uracil-DNA glycosylase [Motilibacter rhizosphaerae]RZS87349.1 uracil-DNA glycosylase family 4 [Motilibacter rhizosphaerae]
MVPPPAGGPGPALPGERHPFVPPGSGWPGDPATPSTPVARDADEVLELARTDDLAELDARVSVCRACPRLVAWREETALARRRAYADQAYWGRPIAGWGDPAPRLLVVGLAPAAHGGNRTGRIFTGDASGDFLFAALHRAGLAALPTSLAAGDGQRLLGVRMLAAVRCAPPDNKPTPGERDTCAPWLDRELELATASASVAVALGGFAWQALLAALARSGAAVPRPAPRFGHGTEVRVGSLTVVGSYHPSQQNTFTGRLTPSMMDAVLGRAAQLAGLPLAAVADEPVSAASVRSDTLLP